LIVFDGKKTYKLKIISKNKKMKQVIFKISKIGLSHYQKIKLVLKFIFETKIKPKKGFSIQISHKIATH